ncbi:MarR family transcriptional regulator [Gordonibacter sp. 28C]|uniref:MarR family winged helix-turn-helix transcriptional regulator n=1 Tax=Gordonibacter sp. 28C TaxID=2078569 RepID=UPI000DF85423|nr:MarR family winged helix-turn-helix transcriptional regulator [Gordonibacter sp. 28C]RDB61225.1 MarR family transcriptional regulator [Gordonibacter sp. 28C]
MEARTARANREYNNLFRLCNELYHNAAARMGLSDSALDILYALDALGDGCLQKDVCAAAGMSKQTVNTSVHKLERAGIVELRVEHGRGTHLYLTPEGRALVAERIRPLVAAEEAAFSDLAPQECEELLRLSRAYLDRLRTRVEALPYPDGARA